MEKDFRDFLLCVGVGLVLVSATLLAALLSKRSDVHDFFKWAGLAGNTLLVFGYTVWSHKPSSRRPRFWVIIICLLVVHLLSFVFTLRTVTEWKITWWGFIDPMEYILIGTALFLAGFRPAYRIGKGSVRR